MQVIGLCRFSYPAIGGFQVDHSERAAREAYLFAPERMEQRFRTFESFTLPSMRAQTDPDFTFLIVIGDSLPAPYRARLNALVSDLPHAVIQSHPPRKHRELCQDALNSVRLFDDSPCLQFRMDDDDAVALSFVQDLRNVASSVAGLLDLERHVAIDFNQGYIARPGPEGLDVEQVIRPFWTPALGMLIRPKARVSIMNFSHAKLPRRMPCVSIPAVDMFVRGHNDFNDSRQSGKVTQPSLTRLTAEGEESFRSTFGVNAETVRRLYRPEGRHSN